MEDPNEPPKRALESQSKRLKEAEKIIHPFLARWRENIKMLAKLLSHLDPMTMFLVIKSAPENEEFMTDPKNDLWRKTALLYLKLHIGDTGEKEWDPLKDLINVLRREGIGKIDYFRIMLAVHLVKYHLLVEEGLVGPVSYQNVSDITKHLENIVARDEDGIVNFMSSDIDFVVPGANRFFSLRFDIGCMGAFGGLPNLFTFSIVINSPQLAGEVEYEDGPDDGSEEERFEILRITSIHDWYPELENHLRIDFNEQADTEYGWGENQDPKWSNWEQLFVLVYRILELPGIFAKLPFDDDRDQLINKKLY